MDMSGMDMGGMDMSGMGMDGAQAGLFTAMNKSIALGFWYGIAGCVGALALLNLVAKVQSRHRRKLHQRDPRSVPSRPTGRISQAYATMTAIARESWYSQPVYFTGRISKYFSPLPVGRWLLLITYWVVLLVFLWSDTILSPGDPMYAYKWEKVGFRAAWVSVTQIPMIYLLSCKSNPISMLTGISYERFNWFHRWAARTIFFTVIVHWSFFFREWSIAEIVSLEMQMMTMVKYGFGSWGIITWMVLSGFGFFRDLNYELFVLQHIAAAATLLWCLYCHVPSYARYNIWMAVGFVVFDWGMRMIGMVVRNVRLRKISSPPALGYSTQVELLPGDVVRLTLKDVGFTWRAGQHAYITVPTLRMFESHPFTIASPPLTEEGLRRRELSFLIQARSGFSKNLRNWALRAEGTDGQRRAFLSGPWGTPPDLRHYQTVVCVACSTGVSFVMPILQDLIAKRACVERVEFHWVVRRLAHVTWLESEIKQLAKQADLSNVRLGVHIHVTRHLATETAAMRTPALMREQSLFTTPSSSTLDSKDDFVVSSADVEELTASSIEDGFSSEKTPSMAVNFHGRPQVGSMIRPAVEEAHGETAVVVCGGLSITAQSRTFVAALSDERAVHKGTGAQGIFLYTETYGW